jgi:hypothetical protein
VGPDYTWVLSTKLHKYEPFTKAKVEITVDQIDFGVGLDGKILIIPTTGNFLKTVAAGDVVKDTTIPNVAAASRIIVDHTGNPWIVNMFGNVSKYTGTQWESVAGDSNNLAIGADGSIWSLNAYG